MQHLACKSMTKEVSVQMPFVFNFQCCICMCMFELVTIAYGQEGCSNKKQALCSLFFLSLSVSHMDVFPQNPSFLCVPFCFFLPPCVFLSFCLSVSHPFLISPSGPPTAAAGKVLFLFPPHFLLLHSVLVVLTTHLSFLFIHPSSQLYLSVFPLFSIVHHGTALTQTQLNFKLTYARSSTESHKSHVTFCAIQRFITEK